MNWTWLLGIAFLGAGGKDPRVDIFDADSEETRSLVELPPMNSAYAIDIEYEDGTIAAGTKGGLVYIVMGAGSQKTEKLISTRKLEQGAPVLSVCWVKKSVLAVSDTARRCLLRHINQEESPHPLDTKGETICSLMKLPDGLLTGLSSGGKLLFWEPLEGRLIKAMDVPTPPPISGLVSMVYWPADQTLVFPSRIGELTLFDLEKNNLRHLKVHEGTFYAVSLWGELLLTAGMQDGRMKIWKAGSDRPIYDFQVGKEVISAVPIGHHQAKVLVVKAGGKANIYTIEEKNLKFMSRLPGENYRVVFVSSPERIKAINEQWRNKEVRRIVKEIQNGEGRVPNGEIDGLHYQLTQLGYEHVSLAIRSEQAAQNGNIIQALRFSVSLMQMFPKDDPKTCSSMERYATLLEKFWHLPEADAVYRQILDVDPNYQFLVTPHNLEKIAEKFNENPWVIEPEIPIKDMIESANTIRKRFTGRYVINRLEPVSCGQIQLNPEAIVEKYERIRKESQRESLPLATAEQVWWLSRQEHDQVQLVAFGQGATNNIQGLQFVVQVFCGDLDTVVVPVVLFDWRDTFPNESIEDQNQRASDVLNHIRNNDLSNAYLAAVHSALKEALRRLVTEKRPQRR